jgi:hypothetical protein
MQLTYDGRVSNNAQCRRVLSSSPLGKAAASSSKQQQAAASSSSSSTEAAARKQQQQYTAPATANIMQTALLAASILQESPDAVTPAEEAEAAAVPLPFQLVLAPGCRPVCRDTCVAGGAVPCVMPCTAPPTQTLRTRGIACANGAKAPLSELAAERLGLCDDAGAARSAVRFAAMEHPQPPGSLSFQLVSPMQTG